MRSVTAGTEMQNGAIYIVTQNPRYVDLLLSSASSLKHAMPELPITVFSQFPIESPLFEKIVRVKPTEDGFYDKARLIQESPYDRTLFVDADTYVVSTFPEVFTLLDRFDCAATHEEYLNTDWNNDYVRPDIPASFPEFNTGILLLKRSDRMARLLQEWSSLYLAYLREKPIHGPDDQPLGDQPFFRVAAYYSDVRIATLSREYNCKFRGQGYLNGPVKILHGHVNFQPDARHIKKDLTVLNASNRPRVYIAGKVYEQKVVGRLVSRRLAHKVGSFPELPKSIISLRAKRLSQIVKERGVRKTLAKILAVG